MRISTRLRLTSGVVLVLLGLALAALIWSFRETARAHREESLVAALQTVTMEKAELREEYLLRREERARRQWETKTERADLLLKQATEQFKDRPRVQLLQDVRQHLDLSTFLFRSLAGYLAEAGHAESLFSSLEAQRMLSQTIVNGYDLHNSVEKLRESLQENSVAVHAKTTRAVVVLMLLAAVAAIGDALSVDQLLTKRIALLREGSEIMRAGNLEHQIAVEGSDELTELTRASNALAENLRASYTSLANLEQEVAVRAKAENELKLLSLRYEAILAAAPDIIMEVDGNKIYTWANEAGRIFFGEDVIGKEAAVYFEGEQRIYNTVKSLFDGVKDVVYVESWQRRSDGEKRLLAWWCRVLQDAEGNVLGALSTARDITEQKKAEEEIRRANEELARAAATLTDKVRERTSELEARVEEIGRINDLFVDRELAMVALKERIKEQEGR